MLASEVCVIAGPRGIGKSVFIRNCARAGDRLPAGMREHFAANPPVLHAVELDRLRNAGHPRATVHLDLHTPFADLPPLEPKALALELNADRFAAYPGLDCLAKAERLLVATLAAPRERVLARWRERIRKNPMRVAGPNVTAIYADDGLFKLLYEAWYGFLRTLAPAKQWRVDASTDATAPVSEVR